MPRGEEPLLSQRPSSEQSGNRDLEEEDALLTGERTMRTQEASGWRKWREWGLFAWAMIATAAVIVLAVIFQRQHESSTSGPAASGKRNLIFMVSDGMGPTSLTLTREFMQARDNLPWTAQLTIDKHLIGQSRTRSTSSLVTDSAAGATAFSCGQKSYNGAISVLPNHEPCGSVLEAAKKAGYMTGLVVTTRITDATPAVFAAHVNMRSEEDLIAEQMIGDGPLGHLVDIMIGGGRSHFLPNTTDGSSRDDDKDIIARAQHLGYDYIGDRKSFADLQKSEAVDLNKKPLLGLFALNDVPYEVDRRNENDIYPALDETATFALIALSEATRDSDKGFFIMIEGSRIDHAGHGNDPAAQVHEVLAYDKTIDAVLKFIESESTETLMVSTSDHETGGLATARQLHDSYPDYLWYPQILVNASKSAERLGQNYHEQLMQHPDADIRQWLQSTLEKDLAVTDYSDEEINLLVEQPSRAPYTFADIISRRAQTGWSTHGHSGADVNIYASSARAAAPLVGNHENTEVGEFLRKYLDVDVDSITSELKKKGKAMDDLSGSSWMGKVPDSGERLDGQDHLDHYAGDNKKHRRCDICGI